MAIDIEKKAEGRRSSSFWLARAIFSLKIPDILQKNGQKRGVLFTVWYTCQSHILLIPRLL
jgi:hypothetical protein